MADFEEGTRVDFQTLSLGDCFIGAHDIVTSVFRRTRLCTRIRTHSVCTRPSFRAKKIEQRTLSIQETYISLLRMMGLCL